MPRCAPPASPVLSFCCFILQSQMQHWDHFNTQLLVDRQEEPQPCPKWGTFAMLITSLSYHECTAWEGVISCSGNSMATELHSYQEILAPESPLYSDTVSNLLIVGDRKCKVRAGEHRLDHSWKHSSLIGTNVIWNSLWKQKIALSHPLYREVKDWTLRSVFNKNTLKYFDITGITHKLCRL